MIRYIIRKALAVLLASVAAMAIAAEDYFTGEGGKGLSISVEKPAVQNVGEDVSWLPDYANNVISDSIKKYSNIEVVERRYEAAVSSSLAHEEQGAYTDDAVEAGRFKAAKSQLQVKIIGKTKSYNVSATVVDKESLTSQASFNEDCSFAALENGAVLKKAVQSILGQLGVALSSTAKKELEATTADSNRSIEAQKLVAQAQKAEEQGSNVAALRLAMAASRRDASLERAAVTKTRVSQAVQSGDFGAKARNAIQRRKEMKALIDETKAYYADNLPYVFVYDPEIEQGKIDYEKETFEVFVSCSLFVKENVYDDFDMIESALKANPEYEDWKLNPEYIFIGGYIYPIVSIINSKGEVIASVKGEGNQELQGFPFGWTAGVPPKISNYRLWDPAHFRMGGLRMSISASKNTDGMSVRVDGFYIYNNAYYPPDKRYYKSTNVAALTVEEYVNNVMPSSPKVVERMNKDSVIYKYVEEKRRAEEQKKEEEKRRADEEAKKAIAAVTAESTDDFIVGIDVKSFWQSPEGSDILQYSCIKGLSKKSDKQYEYIIMQDRLADRRIVSIATGAFKDCTTIKQVTFPNDVDVDDKAFMGCTSLETVVIPSGVEIAWGKNVFKGCTALSEESKRAIIASGYKGDLAKETKDGKDKSKKKSKTKKAS